LSPLKPWYLNISFLGFDVAKLLKKSTFVSGELRLRYQGFKGGLYKSIGYNAILCAAPKFYSK
jgi:hypothetical protein